MAHSDFLQGSVAISVFCQQVMWDAVLRLMLVPCVTPIKLKLKYVNCRPGSVSWSVAFR